MQRLYIWIPHLPPITASFLVIRLIRVRKNLPERVAIIHDFFPAALAAFESTHIAAGKRRLLDLVHLATALGADLVGHD